MTPTTQVINNQAPDKFDAAVQFTLHPAVEGGYTVDNGGPTNFGITQKTLDVFNNKNGYPSQSVKDMTIDDAKYVARKAFYDEPKLDSLPNRTAVAAFDYSLNSGPYQAILDLQRTVGVKADGRMGPNTQAAIDKYVAANGEDQLLNDYTNRRVELMQSLIHRNPKKYGPNAAGWANRIANLKRYVGIADVGNNDVGSNDVGQ